MLSEVILENYRGFYKENKISIKNSTGENNINILIARNDTGKTTFLNSIYWCFYGEEQFSSSSKHKDIIPSNRTISETPIGEKLKVKVTVILNDEKGIKYKFTREQTFKRGENRDESLNVIPYEVNFEGLEMKKDLSGFSPIPNVSHLINSIIPKSISSFFLLDGERLKEIFKSDINYEIKKSIKNVANISAIEGSLNKLKKLAKKYANEQYGGDPQYEEYSSEIEKCENEINKKNDELETTRGECNDIKRKLRDLDDFLMSHNEKNISQLAAREKELTENNQRLDLERKDDEEKLAKSVINAYILKFSLKMMKKSYDKFNEISKSPDFPPHVDPERIKFLLTKHNCICGRIIEKNSEEEKVLTKLSDKKSYKQYTRIIGEGLVKFHEKINSEEDAICSVKDLRKRIKEKENLIEKNEISLKDISVELGSSNKIEVIEKREEKEMLERSLSRNVSDIDTVEKDITAIEDHIKEKQLLLKKHEIASSSDKENSKKLEKCNQLVTYLSDISEKLLIEIKNEIEKTTSKNFLELHWKAKEYEKITIKDDFSLSIKDKHLGEIISSLSAGASLCFGLAFMSALRDYSGYEVPVIIDSPVGKIDEGNRENIANYLPKQLSGSQIILLVTGSEYTSVFKSLLKDKISNKILLSYNSNERSIDVDYE